MGDILLITLPIFAMIALGYGTVRFGLFAGADMRVLGKYVLNIALPALLFSVLKRPMVIGLILGLAVSVTGAPLPAVLVRVLDMQASSASALALFVIGGALVGLPMRGNRILATEIVIGKLLVHPAITFALIIGLAGIGMAMPQGDLATALILSAAMPMFGIYTILSQDYGYEGLASLALLGATTGAFFTLTFLIGWRA